MSHITNQYMRLMGRAIREAGNLETKVRFLKGALTRFQNFKNPASTGRRSYSTSTVRSSSL